MRLQKFLAAGGVAARRKAEILITEGRVTVNGKVVSELGTKIQPDHDRVCVDGQAVVAKDFFYVVLNKPKGCITAVTDDRGRTTVMDYLPNLPVPVKPVGRLDYYTEGILLLTNDGELAARLLSAKFHVPKTYHAKLRGQVTREHLQELRQGIVLDDGSQTRPAEVNLLPSDSRHSWVALTIYEGKHRQIHRMFEQLGFEVQKLQRVAFATLAFHGLRIGDARELNQLELNALRDLVELDHSTSARGAWKASRESTDIPRRAREKARMEAEAAAIALDPRPPIDTSALTGDADIEGYDDAPRTPRREGRREGSDERPVAASRRTRDLSPQRDVAFRGGTSTRDVRSGNESRKRSNAGEARHSRGESMPDRPGRLRPSAARGADARGSSRGAAARDERRPSAARGADARGSSRSAAPRDARRPGAPPRVRPEERTEYGERLSRSRAPTTTRQGASRSEAGRRTSASRSVAGARVARTPGKPGAAPTGRRVRAAAPSRSGAARGPAKRTR